MAMEKKSFWTSNLGSKKYKNEQYQLEFCKPKQVDLSNKFVSRINLQIIDRQIDQKMAWKIAKSAANKAPSIIAIHANYCIIYSPNQLLKVVLILLLPLILFSKQRVAGKLAFLIIFFVISFIIFMKKNSPVSVIVMDHPIYKHIQRVWFRFV